MLTQVNILSAFLYLRQAEPMPEPILNDEGELDVAADNAAIERWNKLPTVKEYDFDRLERFITRTEQLLEELETIELTDEEEESKQYMTLFYDAAKDVFDHDKKLLRTYFIWLYLVLFQREDGPRWGEFVSAYGVENFNQMVRNRFSELI